jgi:uncharacterized membrane protein
MNAILGTLLSLSILAGGPFTADEVGVAFHPADETIKLLPGEQATVTLYVESRAAESLQRVELAVTAVDWRVEGDGTRNSAAAWIALQPATVALVSGEMQRLRVTVKVPGRVDPGLYRAGVKVGSGVFRMTIHVLAPATVPKWRAAR